MFAHVKRVKDVTVSVQDNFALYRGSFEGLLDLGQNDIGWVGEVGFALQEHGVVHGFEVELTFFGGQLDRYFDGAEPYLPHLCSGFETVVELVVDHHLELNLEQGGRLSRLCGACSCEGEALRVVAGGG